MRTLIVGGTVVSAEGRVRADVLVSAGTIEAVVAPHGDLAETLRRGGDLRLIDATDRYVVPGGVDVHTHMELPFGGTYASDTFETGTRAAAHGGTTTIIDFAVQREGEEVRECLDAWFAKAEGQCAVDYAFHMILGGIDDRSLKEMDTLVDDGITSFKLFMAYPGVLYSDDGEDPAGHAAGAPQRRPHHDARRERHRHRRHRGGGRRQGPDRPGVPTA